MLHKDHRRPAGSADVTTRETPHPSPPAQTEAQNHEPPGNNVHTLANKTASPNPTHVAYGIPRPSQARTSPPPAHMHALMHAYTGKTPPNPPGEACTDAGAHARKHAPQPPTHGPAENMHPDKLSRTCSSWLSQKGGCLQGGRISH